MTYEQLPDPVRTTVLQALQDALVDLTDLSLLAKQAHWNVVGRHFQALHEFLDQVVETTRNALDEVAERSVTLGGHPDGRAGTVAAGSALPQLDTGPIDDTTVVKVFADLLGQVAGRMRGRIADTEAEPVSQDLFIGITADLEKQQWMLRAQL